MRIEPPWQSVPRKSLSDKGISALFYVAPAKAGFQNEVCNYLILLQLPPLICAPAFAGATTEENGSDAGENGSDAGENGSDAGDHGSECRRKWDRQC